MDRSFYEEHVTHGTTDFPMAVYHCSFPPDASRGISVHYHREFETIFAVDGAIRVQLEGGALTLAEDEGAFINSGVLHSPGPQPHTRGGFLAIVFAPELIAQQQEKLYETYLRAVMRGELVIPPQLPRESLALAREALTLYETRPFGYELLIKSDMTRMMALCVARATRPSAVRSNPSADVIKSVLDDIHQHYENPLTLGDLAAHAHICREHLCRVFHEVSDLSPIAYLNRYRILQSAALLRNTNDSVSSIAAACGFNSSSYFNKLFLRYMKCAPTAYRQENAQK